MQAIELSAQRTYSSLSVWIEMVYCPLTATFVDFLVADHPVPVADHKVDPSDARDSAGLTLHRLCTSVAA
jgi:hypothetical protein